MIKAKRTVRVTILYLSIILLVACDTSTNFQTFRSDSGNFLVLMPMEPQEQAQSTQTQSGVIEGHLFLADTPDGAYMVSYLDLPEELAKQSTTKSLLDNRRDTAVKNANAQLISEKEITLNGNPGREFTAHAVGKAGERGFLKVRVFLVKDWVYQITVLTLEDRVTEAQMDVFLDSFRLLDDAKTEQ